jgi:hypothetical protein
MNSDDDDDLLMDILVFMFCAGFSFLVFWSVSPLPNDRGGSSGGGGAGMSW